MIFETLDSVVIPLKDSGELESYSLECSDGGTSISGGGGCEEPLEKTEECPFQKGNPFIRFDLSDSTVLTTPPTVTISSVTFNHFVYEYNTFI